MFANIINALLQGRRSSINAYDNVARKFYKAIFYMLVLSIFPVIFNYIGFKEINIIIGLILPFFACYYATQGRVVEAAVAVGVIMEPRTPIESAKKMFKRYGKELSNVLIVISFFCLLCGTLQFSRNIFAVFVIYLCIWVFVLIAIAWNMKPNISKKLVYAYTMVTIVIAFGSLISGATYRQIVGFDPYSSLKITKADKTADAIISMNEDNKEKARDDAMKVYLDKVKRGGILSSEEEKDFNRLLKKTEEKSLPSRGKKIVSGILSSDRHSSAKTWKQVFCQEYEGRGDQQNLRTAVFGKDILPGDKVIVKADCIFEVYDNGWKKIDRYYSAISKSTETNKFLGVRLRENEKATVEIHRFS